MAVRDPLVWNPATGRPERLQPGDTLGITGETGLSSKTAAAAILIGQVVYISAANTVNLARANAVATAEAIGFARTAIANAAQGPVQLNGALTLTTAEWDAVTGGAGGLVAGSVYFLSAATAGRLTTVPPSANGEFAVELGVALSTTEFFINIKSPIRL